MPNNAGGGAEFPLVGFEKRLPVEADIAIGAGGSWADFPLLGARWAKGVEKERTSKENAPMEAVGMTDAQLALGNLRRGMAVWEIQLRRRVGPN